MPGGGEAPVGGKAEVLFVVAQVDEVLEALVLCRTPIGDVVQLLHIRQELFDDFGEVELNTINKRAIMVQIIRDETI